MKTTKFLMLAALAIAAASCTANKETNAAADESTGATKITAPYSGSISGEWRIMEIEMNDSVSIKPAEVTPDGPQTVMFTDSTYHFQTNCNLVQGDYRQSGDSISFEAGLSTRMACPDMSVEDALNQLLPQLTGLSMDNDSTLRISAENKASYILLGKMK